MNVCELDVIKAIDKEGYSSQRTIAESINYSLGSVNSAVRSLVEKNYLNENLFLTEKTIDELHRKKPKNAIILAAGFGMRMVPINLEMPKGLLKIHGQPLIERLIEQLNEAGIYDIEIVVGFMKERFEYLIDKYGVNLIYNRDYAVKNNLHSLSLVVDKISNTYIVPSDVWAETNPFSQKELYSWYSVSDMVDDDSSVRINRKMELVAAGDGKAGNTMIGIAYILEEEASILRRRVKELCKKKKYDKAFWEEALFNSENKMMVYGRVYKSYEVYEINTYEQLRESDENSENLSSEVIDIAAEALRVKSNAIKNIRVLKKGMTNRSFLFSCEGKEYIMRVPGEGTDKLINRREEYSVYKALEGKDISDEVIFISPEKGYKITKYWDSARVCDPLKASDVKLCMKHLRNFHERRLEVPHTFDLFKQIEFYQSFWEGQPSIFPDYIDTKNKVLELKNIIEEMPKEWVLTHIDAVPDNFLFVEGELRLIDWEYSGMQDPHVDIAMFAIYSLYNRKQVDALINNYFTEGCSEEIRTKIYCYIAICGLLWSNWCEFKRHKGVEFGEYSLRQYRYAKEYYKIAKERVNVLRDEINKGMRTG